MPLKDKACIVLVDPNVAELATLRTDRVMTTLKMEGRALIFAAWIARTNGEALVFAPEEPSKSSELDGRINPTRKRLRT